MSDVLRDIVVVKYCVDKFVGFGKENIETFAEFFVSFFAYLCVIKDLFWNVVNVFMYYGMFIVGSFW